MAGLDLRLDELLLDLENPRISRAGSQREALQKIIEDQDVKLIVLADSIVSDGLNPMDRWLVLKSPTERGKYIVLEGNRRLSTIRLLNNRAVMDDLEVRAPVKRKLIELSEQFDLDNIAPIDCFEVADRQDATTWINQRHTGENKGRGIVGWGGVATARFRGRDPALQALDLVLTHGDLTEDEKATIEDQFPITTLDRLLSTPGVRSKIGVEITDAKLMTDLPAMEVIKPLRRMVLELGTGAVTVTQLKLRDQMIAHVSKYDKDLPTLSLRSGKPRPVDEWVADDFRPPSPKPKPKPRPAPVRRTLIPRDCYLTVSNAKIAEIAKELRTLTLADFPHSISVLFRVFLEQSTDHYLTAAGIPLENDASGGGGKRDKNLRAKVGEAVGQMVKTGTPKRHLAGVERGIDDKNSPLFIEALHDYVHSRFYSPVERELKVAWDNSQLFFEKIWQ